MRMRVNLGISSFVSDRFWFLSRVPDRKRGATALNTRRIYWASIRSNGGEALGWHRIFGSLQSQVFVGKWTGLWSGEISSIGASGLPQLVFVHASPKLFDRLLVCAEYYPLVLLFAVYAIFFIELTVVLSERTNFVAEDFALFWDFPLIQLIEQLFLPLFAAVAIHCVKELCVGAHSTNVNARWVLVLRWESVWMND